MVVKMNQEEYYQATVHHFYIMGNMGNVEVDRRLHSAIGYLRCINEERPPIGGLVAINGVHQFLSLDEIVEEVRRPLFPTIVTPELKATVWQRVIKAVEGLRFPVSIIESNGHERAMRHLEEGFYKKFRFDGLVGYSEDAKK